MKQSALTGSILISTALFSCMAFSHSPATAYNWSGYYAGLSAGLVKNTLNMTDLQATTFNASIEQAANPQFSGGVQLGARHQIEQGSISGLYGLEFSANFSNASSNNVYGSNFALYQLNSNTQLKNTYLLELIGGVALDKTLLFLAAGCAWTRLTGNVVNLDGIPFFHSFSVNKTSPGGVLGAGIEYAYNEKISMRFKADVIAANAYNTLNDTGSAYQISNRAVQATLGVNYKFR